MPYVLAQITRDDFKSAKEFLKRKKVTYNVIADLVMFRLVLLLLSVAEEDRADIENGLREACETEPTLIAQ